MAIGAVSAIPLAAARPLLDLLGARWRVPVPALAVAWDAEGGSAAFAMGDGSVVIVPAAWNGAPRVRPRDGGGIELVPGSSEPPDVVHLAVHSTACCSITADPDGGFLAGSADGRIARLRPTGEVETLESNGAGPALLAAGRGGWRVTAVGNVVRRLGHGSTGIDVAGPVGCLALDPAGARLAVAHRDGVTLWAGGDTPRTMPAPGDHLALAWSCDSAWLAGLTRDGAVYAWTLPNAEQVRLAPDGAVAALAALGSSMVTGVGGRLASWAIRQGAVPEQTPCGPTSQAHVTCLAPHPRRPLVAAGYANGTVVLCGPESTALVFLRRAGEGATRLLAFAPDGETLAIATEDGEIAVLAVPDMLFRESAGAQ